MGGKHSTPGELKRYAELRFEKGLTIADAAAACGRSLSWGRDMNRKLKEAHEALRGDGHMSAEEAAKIGGPIPFDDLRPEARRALDDFGYFRYRYLGRISTPWQEDAGHRVVGLMETPQKEFCVINVGPGSGKSTLFTLDIPLWITCKMRNTRGMLGHAAQKVANSYLFRLKNHLEMDVPAFVEDDEVQLGLAVEPEATLIGDFGLFRIPGGLWSAHQILVAQIDGRLITQKEPTWTAWGMDSSYVGGRYKVAVWDDAVEEKHALTEEAITKSRNRWDKVAEKRLEPAGLLLLPGQRLAPEDLYRYNLDKRVGASTVQEHDCCDAEPGAKYHHIVYRAHYEDRCKGEHTIDAPYYPEGCLLDPRRLDWATLEAEQENSLASYLQVYQQEDADPDELLVNPLWVKGGTDPQTKEWFIGCWDDQRGLCELPPDAGRVVSVLSTDPSPTKFWATGWWCVEAAEPHRRFLMDLYRQKMSFDQYIERDPATGAFSGLLEEWWQRSKRLGHTITHLIFEENAAARFVLHTQVMKDWLRLRNVTLIKHQTTHSREDPQWGPRRLATLYKHGLVRFPGLGPDARTMSLKQIDEVQKWPKGQYDDCVYQQLFLELRLRTVLARDRKQRKGRFDSRRPSWVADIVA